MDVINTRKPERINKRWSNKNRKEKKKKKDNDNPTKIISNPKIKVKLRKVNLGLLKFLNPKNKLTTIMNCVNKKNNMVKEGRYKGEKKNKINTIHLRITKGFAKNLFPSSV